MKTLKTAILALSVAALPLTAFAQGVAPVDAPKVDATVNGSANTGIVPPKAGVTSETKAKVDGTRAETRTDAKAAGAAESAKKPEKHSATHKARKHVAAAKPAKHDGVKTDTKTDTTVR